jgi:hypothetical protein
MLNLRRKRIMAEEQIIINKTEKPNSYETGSAGSRFKLYFDTASDLKQQIEALNSYGFPITQDITKLKETTNGK